MRWKYRIVHSWEEGARLPWGEVFLKPETGRNPFILTIDGLGDPSNPLHGSERAEFIQDALRKLNGMTFWIEGEEMIVRDVDFTLPEFLEWVKVWIRRSDALFEDLAQDLSLR